MDTSNESEAQHEYWRLSKARIRAYEAHRIADRDLEEFYDRHPGESFKVFHPDDIRRAFRNDVKPLFPLGDRVFGREER